MTKFGQEEYNDFMARMLGFVIGIFIGEIIGVFTMCLCRATSEADKCMDSTDSEE